MKVWLVGSPELKKYLDAVYERSDQAESVADGQAIFSAEVNMANSVQLVSGEDYKQLKEVAAEKGKRRKKLADAVTVAKLAEKKIKSSGGNVAKAKKEYKQAKVAARNA